MLLALPPMLTSMMLLLLLLLPTWLLFVVTLLLLMLLLFVVTLLLLLLMLTLLLLSVALLFAAMLLLCASFRTLLLYKSTTFRSFLVFPLMTAWERNRVKYQASARRQHTSLHYDSTRACVYKRDHHSCKQRQCENAPVNPPAMMARFPADAAARYLRPTLS